MIYLKKFKEGESFAARVPGVVLFVPFSGFLSNAEEQLGIKVTDVEEFVDGVLREVVRPFYDDGIERETSPIGAFFDDAMVQAVTVERCRGFSDGPQPTAVQKARKVLLLAAPTVD